MFYLAYLAKHGKRKRKKKHAIYAHIIPTSFPPAHTPPPPLTGRGGVGSGRGAKKTKQHYSPLSSSSSSLFAEKSAASNAASAVRFNRTFSSVAPPLFAYPASCASRTLSISCCNCITLKIRRRRRRTGMRMNNHREGCMILIQAGDDVTRHIFPPRQRRRRRRRRRRVDGRYIAQLTGMTAIPILPV